MLIPPNHSPQEVMERVNALLRSANSLAVHIDVSHFRYSSPGSADLVMLRPNDFLYTMKLGGNDYAYSASDEGVVEVERSTMTYSTWPSWIGLISPESRFSDMIAAGFPALFHSAWVTSSKWPTFEYKGSDQINGEKTDHLYRLDPASGIYDFWIASDGRILRYRVNDGAGSAIQYTFSNYRFNGPVTLANLHVALPLGSNPYALPDVAIPLGIGKPFPTQGWQNSSGATVDISGGKPVLVVVVDEESDAAANMAEPLTAIGKSVAIAIVPDGPSAKPPTTLASLPLFTDPSGRLLEKLSFPGTPMCYLVAPDGTISKLWFGYDPADREKFLASMVQGTK